MKQKSIIVAPLNWGIGHATRCIPIIQELLKMGLDVIIASDGNALELLKLQFPDLKYHNLPSYHIKYGKKNALLPFIYRWPILLWAISAEHLALKKIIKTSHCVGIISDNRLGLYHHSIPSYYMTHQVNMKAPLSWLSWLGNTIHHFFMKKFEGVWIPDYNDSYLGGQLSYQSKSIKTTFINPLSRLEKVAGSAIIRDFIVVLSGIEPQRTHLEKILRNKLEKSDYTYLIVKGKLGAKNLDTNTVDFLGSDELALEISQSKYVISRAGYSSIMDWDKLESKALLIPTPGQSEQEYLAKHLLSHPLFTSQNQGEINLSKAIKRLNNKSDHTTDHNHRFNLSSFLKNTFTKR